MWQLWDDISRDHLARCGRRKTGFERFKVAEARLLFGLAWTIMIFECWNHKYKKFGRPSKKILQIFSIFFSFRIFASCITFPKGPTRPLIRPYYNWVIYQFFQSAEGNLFQLCMIFFSWKFKCIMNLLFLFCRFYDSVYVHVRKKFCDFGCILSLQIIKCLQVFRQGVKAEK